MVPCEVSAVKFGASSLMRSDIVLLLFWYRRGGDGHLPLVGDSLSKERDTVTGNQSATIFTRRRRCRGPSNSQKKMPCQRPSSSSPLVMNTLAEVPISAAFAWESELPSAWR